MRNLKAKILLFCVFVAAPLYAAKSEVTLEPITTNGPFVKTSQPATTDSDGWIFLSPGLYAVEIFAPAAGTASDPCGVAGGSFDGGSLTIEYSPDQGVTVFDSDEPAGKGITADVRFLGQIGRGYYHRVNVSTAGASTCLIAKFSKTQV